MRTAAAALVAVTALVGTLLAAPGADAADAPDLRERVDVAPGIVRERYGFRTVGGPNDVQVLRFRLDDSRLEVRPELARGQIPGRETVDATLRRQGQDAVAGVNANFFAPSCGPLADGDPCGLVIRDRLVASENHQNGGDWPGAFALFDPAEDWRERLWAVDRPRFDAFVEFRDGNRVKISGIDRQPAGDELVAFNALYAARTGTPSGTDEYHFPDIDLRARTETERTLPEPIGPNSPIPSSGTILAARGAAATHLRARIGTPVELNVFTAAGAWTGAEQAVAAGPLILQDGQITSSAEWFAEGFSTAHHNDAAHPRTIVGFREDDRGRPEMFLVTVDGRQSDSVGITTGEAAELMRDLGAVDAVMMDGGGSTTMAVDGLIVNDPSSSPRPVASSLVVRTNVATPDVTRLEGVNRYATAAAVARDGWPDGAERVVIASGERFPDALTGGPLAADRDAPLLLTASGSVPAATLEALAALGTTQVTLVGGTSAISEDVANTLRARRIEVDRIAGEDRTATAAEVARRIGAPTGRVFLASASTFPDALSAVLPAARSDAPLLLTWPDTLSDATAKALEALGTDEVVVAGGPAALSRDVQRAIESRGYRVTRVAGDDRFETSVALVDWAVRHTDLPTISVALATGADFPDALAGGPYAAHRQMPVLLTHRHDVDGSAAVGAWMDQHDLSAGVLLGGTAVLAGWHRFELQQHIDAQ